VTLIFDTVTSDMVLELRETWTIFTSNSEFFKEVFVLELQTGTGQTDKLTDRRNECVLWRHRGRAA